MIFIIDTRILCAIKNVVKAFFLRRLQFNRWYRYDNGGLMSTFRRVLIFLTDPDRALFVATQAVIDRALLSVYRQPSERHHNASAQNSAHPYQEMLVPPPPVIRADRT